MLPSSRFHNWFCLEFYLSQRTNTWVVLRKALMWSLKHSERGTVLLAATIIWKPAPGLHRAKSSDMLIATAIEWPILNILQTYEYISFGGPYNLISWRNWWWHIEKQKLVVEKTYGCICEKHSSIPIGRQIEITRFFKRGKRMRTKVPAQVARPAKVPTANTIHDDDHYLGSPSWA